MPLKDDANGRFHNDQKYSDENLMKSIFKKLEVLMIEDLEEVQSEVGRDNSDLDEVSSREDPMLSSHNTNSNMSFDRKLD